MYRSRALIGCARAVWSHFGCSYLRGGKESHGVRLHHLPTHAGGSSLAPRTDVAPGHPRVLSFARAIPGDRT